VTESVTESTSISIFVPSRVPDGRISKMVADVEVMRRDRFGDYGDVADVETVCGDGFGDCGDVADVETVCGDGFGDCGDAADVDNGIFSMMGALLWECGSSSMRLTTWVEGVFDFFLGPTRSRGFGIIAPNWEWGPTTRSKSTRGLPAKEPGSIEL